MGWVIALQGDHQKVRRVSFDRVSLRSLPPDKSWWAVCADQILVGIGRSALLERIKGMLTISASQKTETDRQFQSHGREFSGGFLVEPSWESIKWSLRGSVVDWRQIIERMQPKNLENHQNLPSEEISDLEGFQTILRDLGRDSSI